MEDLKKKYAQKLSKQIKRNNDWESNSETTEWKYGLLLPMSIEEN